MFLNWISDTSQNVFWWRCWHLSAVSFSFSPKKDWNTPLVLASRIVTRKLLYLVSSILPYLELRRDQHTQEPETVKPWPKEVICWGRGGRMWTFPCPPTRTIMPIWKLFLNRRHQRAPKNNTTRLRLRTARRRRRPYPYPHRLYHCLNQRKTAPIPGIVKTL